LEKKNSNSCIAAKIVICLCCIFSGAFVYSQDTVNVQLKIDEARSLFTLHPKKSLATAFESRVLAEQAGNARLLAYALNTIGSGYNYAGNNDSAVYYHQQALAIQRSILDDLGIGRSLTNIGIAYTSSGLNDKAIKCFLEAEEKFTKADFEIGLSKLYNSMGSLFYSISDFRNSVIYYKKGIALSEKMDDTPLNYSLKINLANVYGSMNKPREALALYHQSYAAVKSDSNYSDLILVCNNICHEYIDLKNFTMAKKFSDESLFLIRNYEIEDYLKTTSFSNQAEILAHHGHYKEAVNFVDSALKMLKDSPDFGKEIGLKYQLGKMLHKSGDFERSYVVLMDALNLKDSLYSKNLKEKLSEINTVHEVEKKESQIQLLSDAQQKQKTINYLLIGASFISLITIMILITGYRRKKRDHEIIRIQKNEVIVKSKLAEEKQQEILDSINYARRIQYSLLASTKLLDENLKDYFLFFKPKDVVSGDFYWGTKLSNNNFVLVTADSTGHGVPGAIMSMLNISCLNEAINADKLTQPAEILNATRRKVIEHLSNDGSDGGGKDGMDCSLISFDFQNKKLSYAAANNPVWVVRNKKFIPLTAERMPVGKHDKDAIPFTQNEFNLQSGDMVYTLTDGFPDQFGGPNGKKFKYKQLEELLMSIADETLESQKQKLDEVFENWKGGLEQVDDVCVIGIRV
jgi:serine phosphatase RsbU (regulator of sigma subunit)